MALERKEIKNKKKEAFLAHVGEKQGRAEQSVVIFRQRPANVRTAGFPRAITIRSRATQSISFVKKKKKKEIFEANYSSSFRRMLFLVIGEIDWKKYIDCLRGKCKFVLICSEIQRMEQSRES